MFLYFFTTYTADHPHIFTSVIKGQHSRQVTSLIKIRLIRTKDKKK